MDEADFLVMFTLLDEKSSAYTVMLYLFPETKPLVEVAFRVTVHDVCKRQIVKCLSNNVMFVKLSRCFSGLSPQMQTTYLRRRRDIQTVQTLCIAWVIMLQQRICTLFRVLCGKETKIITPWHLVTNQTKIRNNYLNAYPQLRLQQDPAYLVKLSPWQSALPSTTYTVSVPVIGIHTYLYTTTQGDAVGEI